MKLRVFLLTFLASVIGWSDVDVKTTLLSADNEIHYQVSNMPLNSIKKLPAEFTRTIEVGSQVVRMDVDLSGKKITCQGALDALDKILKKPLLEKRFFFWIWGICGFEKQHDEYANAIKVMAEFDPVDDEAAIYMENMIKERNGIDFLGIPFNIEESEGVIVSMGADIGHKPDPNNPLFHRKASYRKQHYFKSYYEIVRDFYVDADKRYNKNAPELVLPFYEKWFGLWPQDDFLTLLREANYIELPFSLSYVMKTGERVHFPLWYASFLNQCYLKIPAFCLTSPN